jgi:hypothetical protein
MWPAYVKLNTLLSSSHYRATSSPLDHQPSKKSRVALESKSPPLGDSPPQYTSAHMIDRIILCASKIHALLSHNPTVIAMNIPIPDLMSVSKALATKFLLSMHAYQPFNETSVDTIINRMYPIWKIGVLEALVMQLMDFRYVCDDITVDQVSILPLDQQGLSSFVTNIQARALDLSVAPPSGFDQNPFKTKPPDVILRVLGQGSFGKVYLINKPARFGNDLSSTLARKTLRKAFNSYGAKISVLRELFIQRDLDHPNVVKLLKVEIAASSNDPNSMDLHMYMEYKEALNRILKERPTDTALLLEFVRRVIRDVCTGLVYVHSLGIIHRDLKPGNILRNAEGTFQLADFGLARYGSDLLGGRRPEGDADVSTYVQTLWYRCPELLLGAREYTQAIDMWSVGCIAYEAAMGYKWFTGETEEEQTRLILKQLGSPPSSSFLTHLPLYYMFVNVNAQRPTPLFVSKFSPDANAAFVALVSAMTSYDPSMRMLAHDVLLTPFMMSGS